MFFRNFLIFFKNPFARPKGKVKMPKTASTKSAPKYPNFSIHGLIAQKYTAPPIRQKAAPYSLIWPPHASCDQINSAAVAETQNSRSSSGPNAGIRTRTRSTRNRS